MIKIKIADTQFAHGVGLGCGDLKIYPKYFEWYRGTDNINDMILVTESMFHKVDSFTEKIKIGWLIEPVTINSDSYGWMRANWHKFDYILTHNLDFINELNRIIDSFGEAHEFNFDISKKKPVVAWYPFGGCWIMPEQRKVYPKTKLISIIASKKRDTVGHMLRHDAIAALGDKVDVYGNGYKFVENKLEALQDYQYSIVIENEKTPGFFTEKVIDCFMTGTIPIYWGAPEIGEQLTVVHFKNIDDLKDLINNIYKLNDNDKSLPKIAQTNFDKAQQFTCPEDWLYTNFFMKHELLKSTLIKHNIL